MTVVENISIFFQVVFEEGLDMGGLPETLKEDFEKVDRLEGQYRVTSFLFEDVNLEDESPRKGPPCVRCSVKGAVESIKKTFVEKYNPMIRLSKVSVSN